MIESTSSKPETEYSTDELIDRVSQAAEQMADSFDKADDSTRPTLIKTAAEKLEPRGVMVRDLHDVMRHVAELDADALPDKKGAHFGLTRAELLRGKLGRVGVANPRRQQR
jgi:hypothetical protein